MVEKDTDQLERMRQVACRTGLELFLKAHRGLYLLGSFPAMAGDLDSWSFSTQVTAKIDDLLAEAKAEGGRGLTSGKFLAKIEKSERNPWRGRISVGRAANNDVVIKHPSVSKLHAHFMLDPGTEPNDVAKRLRLMDAGSKNGGLINGRPMPEGDPVNIQSGDYVTFGEVACEVLDAGTLHTRIRSVYPIDGFTATR